MSSLEHDMPPIEYWNEEGEFILVAKDNSYRVRVRLFDGMVATLDYLKPKKSEELSVILEQISIGEKDENTK